MQVVKGRSPLVNTLAQIWIGLIRRPEQDRVGLRQGPVQRPARRSPGHDSDSEFLAGGMEGLGAFGDGFGHNFGRARRSETAKSYRLPVLNVFGGLRGAEYRNGFRHA